MRLGSIGALCQGGDINLEYVVKPAYRIFEPLSAKNVI